MLNAAGALDAYSHALSVAQNNVANASTPGYVKQRQTLEAMPFDIAAGDTGGVRAGEIQSSRNRFADQAVRRDTTSLGTADQTVESLTAIQNVFDISGASGVSGTISNLIDSLSALQASPSNTTAQQQVISQAGAAAAAFRQAYGALAGIRDNAGRQIQTTVDAVNRITTELAQFNRQAFQSSGPDPGLDAQIHAALDELSQYVPVNAVEQDNGAVDVTLNGRVPLVLGSHSYALTADVEPGNNPPARVLSGALDATADIDGGQLGALLQIRNQVLPSLIGEGSQPGALNTLAGRLADRVNAILGAGSVLFSYDANGQAAQTIAVDSNATPQMLGSVSSDAALSLSGLVNESQGPLGGLTFSEFYGQIAADVGAQLSTATDQQTAGRSILAQDESLRQQMSGVSLDEEAMIVAQFQQAYEANSKLIQTLDQLAQSVIDMLH
jgi:flagellar hook-associated protein 1 FlgK